MPQVNVLFFERFVSERHLTQLGSCFCLHAAAHFCSFVMAVMDAALLLIAGNESCPQPQTSEHLAAIEIMRLKHIIILQVGLVINGLIVALA